MKAYVAVRWYSDGEMPDVRLYESMDFAAEWLLYPWREDSGYSEEDMIRFKEDLLNWKDIELSNHEHGHILNMAVAKDILTVQEAVS